MGRDKSNDDINSVIKYWDKNPVHSVEFKECMDVKSYCNEIDSLRWSDNERWAKKRFYDFTKGDGNRLLDAGCGIGVFTRFFAKKGYEVHAIDITPSAIETTRQSLEAFNLHAEVKLGSVEAIPYPSDYFDFIVSNGVIHHTPNTEKAVEEFYRVLKPGGIASVCIYYKNIFLRQPLFPLIKLLLPFILKQGKSEGREGFFCAKTPEEFVRVYDGNETPIAKVYSRKQADELFKCFEILASEPHYFPIRFMKIFKIGGIAHKFFDNYCGTLIYYLVKKSSKVS